MTMSLVESAYRRSGVYDRMLLMMLDLTKHYDEVASCHHILNNPVIVAKLKRGFFIFGTEMKLEVGQVLQLRFFHNPQYRELFFKRYGWNA